MVKYLLVLFAYLIGSIPFSYILGKIFKGQDIRKLGSGNLGATNAFRVFGKPIGFAVLILDTLKSGFLVFIMINTTWMSTWDLFPALIYGFISVIGHVFPIWFKFKGGKGVASSFGLLLIYNPLVALAMVIAFLITEYITRYVSVSSTVASIMAFITVVCLHFFVEPDLIFVIITGLAASLIIYRHRSNYKRLKMGTENRVKLFDKLDQLLKKETKTK
ncbi:MAG: acyl-phosphate glycerol 3-phosphate acyltransferase [Tenericutes bacterium HGW-Tenericutes-1]|jgi:glycerol-3-phosphate acyltransferase PlsY|nr:MAG: acyl-phosphate glycerol 3-phosphate acyltransferase [Tenericutes bacterium HGW-Tenericutes-1]